MHKYKFSGFNQSVLHVVTEKEDYLQNQWLDINTKILLKEISQKNMQSWQCQLEDLFHLGAIYLNEERLTDSAFLQGQAVSAGQLLRFHLQPRRYSYDWDKIPQLLVYEDSEMLVVDKPAGVPVHPTVDNQKENLLYHLSRHYSGSIFMVHRLDLETQGLILFAKTKHAQSELTKLFAERKIKKTYTAILTQPGLSMGLKSHWMFDSQRAPKKLSPTPVVGTKICELNVRNVSTLISQRLRDQFQLPPQSSLQPQEWLYLADIELLTGRTHQIRAQLSFLGYPIIGDSVYGGRAHSLLGLQSSCIEFEDLRSGKNLTIKHPLYQET